MTTDRAAAKEVTRAEIQALCGKQEDAVRVLFWMNGAQREEGEIVQMLTTVNQERDDLDAEDEKKVENAVGFLGWMVGEEWLTRELRGVDTYYTPGAQFKGRNTW